MRPSDLFLLCFAIGTLWAIASLLLGGLHLGHVHLGHVHLGHSHVGDAHIGKVQLSKGHAGHAKWAGMLNPSCVAVFLAWFGGLGYVLTRYSGLQLWLNLTLSIAFGAVGMWFLASFLQFLQSREKPLDPLDYEMEGVLGRVSSVIRGDGVGEILYVREGARRCVPARSEDHTAIERGQEVIVVRYERGIAYVRTWDAMTGDGKS
jgi:membrane protein implicated in regulation of membrane protease activity